MGGPPGRTTLVSPSRSNRATSTAEGAPGSGNPSKVTRSGSCKAPVVRLLPRPVPAPTPSPVGATRPGEAHGDGDAGVGQRRTGDGLAPRGREALGRSLRSSSASPAPRMGAHANGAHHPPGREKRPGHEARPFRLGHCPPSGAGGVLYIIPMPPMPPMPPPMPPMAAAAAARRRLLGLVGHHGLGGEQEAGHRRRRSAAPSGSPWRGR